MRKLGLWGVGGSLVGVEHYLLYPLGAYLFFCSPQLVCGIWVIIDVSVMVWVFVMNSSPLL